MFIFLKNAPKHLFVISDSLQKNENLNLSDLDLKKLKLSDEDALALSYLTPGLSRRIQKQLLAQLPASELKKLSRTLSLRNTAEKAHPDVSSGRCSVDRISSTLPRKLSADKDKTNAKEDKQIKEIRNIRSRENTPVRSIEKSYLPMKSSNKSAVNDRTVRSESYHQPTEDVKLRVARSSSVREPKSDYLIKRDYLMKSPDSSLSESYSYKNNDSSSSTKRDDSLSDYSSRYSLYSNPGSRSSISATTSSDKKPSTRKVSRFLRSDFFDAPKEENIIQKEKKEREIETQQVLKEIRDKRVKNKLNLRRERSASRESSLLHHDSNKALTKQTVKETKNEETLSKHSEPQPTMPVYVNVPFNNKTNDANESKRNGNENNNNRGQIIVENNQDHDYVNVKIPQSTKKEKVSKLIRPKSYPSDSNIKNTSSPEKDHTKSKTKTKKSSTVEKTKIKSPEPEVKSNKNKFLQSLEKQIGKLRSFSGVQNGNETKSKDDKKSTVKSAIHKLREQSLPRNLDHCITESGLIKRAVSVEDVTSIGTKKLQPSRKSVTKILGLFKKYEENDDKLTKLKKDNENDKDTVKTNGGESDANSNPINTKPKLERPKSLSLDKSKTSLVNGSKSKLPVNSIKKSYYFENDSLKPYKPKQCNNESQLKLDLNKANSYEPNTENRYSLTTTDDSSVILSPCDDNLSCDSWSVGSDIHHDLTSPISSYSSHHLYSGDENESVIDRIRRKSFYSRFNEKKRTRKPSFTGNYKDLDLYKDVKPSYNKSNDYGSLDRRSVDYRVLNRRSSYDTQDAVKKEYKPYARSSSLLNDGYVNLPQRYETYNPRRIKQLSSLYGNDKDRHALDESTSTEKFNK